MILKKIISGGQTGADQGGLEAGRELGLETGGTAPFNWMTSDGFKKEFLQGYGLVAGPHDPRTYPIRTRENVLNSEGTVIFGNLESPGTRLTRSYCLALDKYLICNPTPKELADWILKYNIRTLNVAGNREQRNPGIKKYTKSVIIVAVGILRRTT